MTPQEIQHRLQLAFPQAEIDTQGDDGRHFDVVIICDSFNGKTPISRHRMVYKALGDAMRADIHALSITALTLQEHTKTGA